MTCSRHSRFLHVLGGLLLMTIAGADMPVAPPLPAVVPGPPAATTVLTWSLPVDGVRVRLIGSHASVRVGQPFDMDFRLENLGDDSRSIQLPLVRRSILSPAEVAPPKQGGIYSGDLRITAELVSGDKTPPTPVQMLAPLPQFGAFPIPGGGQLWITVIGLPPGSAAPIQPFKLIANGRRANIKVPVLHLGEYTSFPGLTRAGKYRITATFTGGTDQSEVRLRNGLDAMGNLWRGQIEAQPIELEVLPAEAPDKQTDPG